jgi:hypothetical protein
VSASIPINFPASVTIPTIYTNTFDNTVGLSQHPLGNIIHRPPATSCP